MLEVSKGDLFAWAKAAQEAIPGLDAAGLKSTGFTPDSLFMEEPLRHSYVWLSLLEKQRTVNKKHGCYTYKHCVENYTGKYIGWIGEGHVIAMAHALGFKLLWTPVGRGAACYLNATKKSLKPISAGRIR